MKPFIANIVAVGLVRMMVEPGDPLPIVRAAAVGLHVVLQLDEKPINVTLGRTDLDSDMSPTGNRGRVVDVGRRSHEIPVSGLPDNLCCPS